TPTPNSEEWKTFSDEEKKKIYAEYEAVNKTPGVTPGLPLGLPKDATTVRVQNSKSLTQRGPSSTLEAPSADTLSSRPTTLIPRSRSPRGSLRLVSVVRSRYARQRSTGSRGGGQHPASASRRANTMSTDKTVRSADREEAGWPTPNRDWL